ncbi:hypothetical protein ACS0TY_026747 [Phlomoides rotata]
MSPSLLITPLISHSHVSLTPPINTEKSSLSPSFPDDRRAPSLFSSEAAPPSYPLCRDAAHPLSLSHSKRLTALPVQSPDHHTHPPSPFTVASPPLHSNRGAALRPTRWHRLTPPDCTPPCLHRPRASTHAAPFPAASRRRTPAPHRRFPPQSASSPASHHGNPIGPFRKLKYPALRSTR